MVSLSEFYRTKAWENFRAGLILDRLNEQGDIICDYCGEPITKKYDVIAHHKKELTESNVNDALISLNPDNIDLVHHRCHNKIHDKFGYVIRQVYLVWGAPLSGKTSYVNEVKQAGDLIVDIDKIWECLSGCESYVKPQRLNSNVFGIRDALIEQVKYRRGKWNNAYVIGGYPLSGERERLIKSLGAREVFIDTSYEECIQRLKVCNDGRTFNEWQKFISEWFDKFYRTPPTLKNF